MLTEIRRLWEHLAWADARLLDALSAATTPPEETLWEYGHILGATELWLARLEQRASRASVWPRLSLEELRTLATDVHAGYSRYLAALDPSGLSHQVAYTNSAGKPFQNTVQEILMHVALHAQYHRGKINLLLRQAGMTPEPTDYIAFLRGTPAATISDPRRAWGTG